MEQSTDLAGGRIRKEAVDAVKKAIRVFDLCIFVVTLILLLFVGCFTLPRLFGITPFSVKSASMEPAIPTGSIVFVNRNDREVELGDIITYGISTGKQKGVYVTHRVHKIKENGLIQTKGDANESADGFMEPDAVVGTVWFHIPRLGFLLDKLEQNHGYLILAGFVFLVNALSMVLKYVFDRDDLDTKEKTKKKQRQSRSPQPGRPALHKRTKEPETLQARIKIVRKENVRGGDGRSEAL